MATVLENYYALRGELEQRMAQAPINAVDLWYYGEIVYRSACWRHVRCTCAVRLFR